MFGKNTYQTSPYRGILQNAIQIFPEKAQGDKKCTACWQCETSFSSLGSPRDHVSHSHDLPMEKNGSKFLFTGKLRTSWRT